MTNSLVKLVRSFSLSLTFFFFRRMDINIGSDTFITLAIQATSMNTSPSVLADEEYIRAAPDSQLSSSNLLFNLLKEEDQYHYNQLLNIQVPHHIQHTLHQVRSLFFLFKHPHHIFHFVLSIAMFISSFSTFCRMDGNCLTQKTDYSTTFIRSINRSCSYHTLIQISTLIITYY